MPYNWKLQNLINKVNKKIAYYCLRDNKKANKYMRLREILVCHQMYMAHRV